MKTYKIAVSWTMTALVEITAESFGKAHDTLENMDISEMQAEYLDDSFEIDYDTTMDANQDDEEIIREIEEH